MSFFEKLEHQISAKGGDAAPQAFSMSITRAVDIDEFLEAIRGYRVQLMQIDKGPFVAQAVQAQLAGVLLLTTQFGRAMARSADPPSEKMTFAMATSMVPALWQGSRLDPHDLLVLTPGAEIDIVSQAGHGMAGASFPQELVKEIADRLGWIPTADESTNLLVALEHNKAASLRAILGAVFSEAVAKPFNALADAWALSKQESLLRALLQCTSAPAPSARSVSNGERARVLNAALAAINDRPEEILTVGDLCRIARASERTLHYAFTERFGLAPAQYMKARRLNGARNDLSREHEPIVKIADVANKWGFWHLGQFAKDYRSWFRELPSETYERKHGANPRRGK
jgi:AraC family ethanolamine operon transcriptional activator